MKDFFLPNTNYMQELIYIQTIITFVSLMNQNGSEIRE